MTGIWINLHFTTILLIVLCGMKLRTQKKTWGVDLRYFWVSLLCTLLLVAQDILETHCATDPALRFWRILLSVIGYVLRPTAALGLLLAICPPERRTWKLWIPALVNLAVNLTAFFSPIAFSFNQKYDFVRGPLGYVVFIVSLAYMIQILMVIRRRFFEGRKAESSILIGCIIGAMAASAVDAFFGGCHINEAIMIGCIFLLFFLRSHDNYLDPMTSLRNRFAFYNDSESLAREISAVASLDMNGLKKLNDTKGHDAGDRALTAIGKCLTAVSNRNTFTYRVGGDEFVVLFLRQSQENVEQVINQIKDSISRTGYSVSIGYVMKSEDSDLDSMLHESDLNMYKEKAAYYQQSGMDRRSRDSR